MTFDLNTALVLASTICALFAVAGLALGPGFGSRPLTRRIIIANAAMGACLCFRLFQPVPMSTTAYAVMWTIWIVATLVFVSAIRLMSDQPDRDRQLVIQMGVAAAALFLVSAFSARPQGVAMIAALCVTWASVIGAVASWQIRQPTLVRIRSWLVGTFGLGAASAAAHLPMRIVEAISGQHTMAHPAMTYVSLLILWVSANVGLMLLVQMRLAERVAALALLDELTGALNRRGFTQRLADRRTATATVTATQASSALMDRHAIILIDIDHFKRVNDTWGHDTGDQVLRWFCLQLQNFTRQGDLLVRLGGEEFAIVLYDCPIADAINRAERVCAWFANQVRFDRNGSELHVTASFGVTEFSGDASTLKGDLVRADEALYAAKHAGRCTVRRWRPAEVRPTDPFDHGCAAQTLVV
jgi:diguanylate cyclase (GGDEF)-like protein